MRPRAFVIAAMCSIIAGCGGDPTRRATPPASQGVRAFVEVLRSDNPEPAYALLSEELKRQLTYEAFALQWKRSASERTAQAEQLEEELQGVPELGERARIEYPDGKTVHLTREGERWLIDSAVVSRHHAARPHDAVTLFADALAEKNYDVVIRLLTERRREGIGEQVESFVTSLQERLASPDNAVELIGEDRAEMRWDDGRKRYKLILRKEDDEWRVDDIQLQPTPREPDDD